MEKMKCEPFKMHSDSCLFFLVGAVPDSDTYRECRSDRFWKAEAPTKDSGLS